MTSVVTGASVRVAPVRVHPSNVAAGGDDWAGVNKPVKATTEAGETVVLKHNDVAGFGPLSRVIPESVKRMLDVKEIVLSHICKDEFELPGATYREAYVIHPDGHRTDGIISDWIDGVGTLRSEPVESFKDGDLAVKENIVKGFLGDPDTTKPLSSNVWVIKATGQPICGDFGNAGQRGITTLGVPRANQQIMWKFARSENVDPVVKQIRNLSDQQVRDMVARAGEKYVHDWTPQQADKISSVLIGNRDRLRKDNVFAHYYQGFHPMLKPSMSGVIAPALMYAWYAQQGVTLMGEVVKSKISELVHRS